MKTTGEVASIIGYKKQYDICAIEIYEALLNNELEWVEFASNDSGKLDDVLIGLKNEIKAYQVKDIAGNLSYSKFVNSDTESIFTGCYKGWKKLVIEYPEKLITAKYISNEKPSSSDKISSYKGNEKSSFLNFKNSFWERIKIEKLNKESIPIEWKDVFEELKEKSNSNDNSLIEFINSFEFVLGNNYNVFENISGNNNLQRVKDIEKISENIFKIIGTRGTTKLNRIQFLNEFDLLSRYETRFKHSFFVDENHYQPIVESIQKLDDIIKNTTNGYIAIIGNAGSGKSTLLTKWIKDRKEKVLRYYAYVNQEMNGEYGFRGEAEIFLKDLLIQIRENQFSPQQNLPSENLSDLQKQLFIELDKLKYEDKKIFIIVDGLDHIEREQKVSQSLIDILPNPEQIPENVYFILGTRTTQNLDNLSDRIKFSLEKDSRTISINPLSQTQIHNLLESHKINLNQKQLVDLQKNTLGHPLFLRYTIEELFQVSIQEYDKLISEKCFKGDIYEEYKIFWNKNKLEDNFIDILGVISRFRYSFVDVNLLPKFVTNRADWDKIQKLSEHFFFKKDNIWQFFHNSFKEFLKAETAKNYITNVYDESRNIDFHRKIFDAIKDCNSDYKWNTLYHLFNAKDFSKLLTIATQGFFREQWFNYRNHKYIFDDIKLTAKATYHDNNPQSLFTCFLAYFELNQRINNFYPSNYYKTFHQLDKIDVANSYIFDNTEIFVSNSNALEYALELYKKGDSKLAFELLKKAEPIYLLNITKEVSQNRYDRDTMAEIDEIELIINWAILSSLYYPINDVIDKVKSITVISEEHRTNRERNIVEESINGITNFLVEIEDWEKLNCLHRYICNIPKLNLFYFYFEIVWNLKNENELYNFSLDKLKNWDTTDINPINRRLALFEVFLNKNLIRGKEIFDRLKSPKEILTNENSLDINNFLNYLFDYSRMFYITSNDFSIESSTFIPTHKKEIVTGFYKEFAELGKSGAYLYIENNDASKGFILRFKQILRYFNYSVTDYNYEYNIQNNKSNLINLILRISSKISEDCFNQILVELSLEWKKPKKKWTRSDKQEVIEFVIDSEINNLWCKDELNNLNSDLFEFGDISSRIDDCIKQIELWASIDEIEKGEVILSKLMEISLDIRYDKDNQFEQIIEWFEKKKNIESEEIEFYIKCLDSIKNKTSGASEIPAKKLLKFSLNRGNGFELFKYLLFDGLVNFNDGIEIILIHFLKEFPEKRTFLIKFFIRIILNFDNDYSYRSSFLEELLKLKLSTSDLNLIINEINIHCVLEHRNSYLIRINEYIEKLNFEYPKSEVKAEKEISYSDYSELKLKDKSSLSEKQVVEKINCYDEIIGFFEQEDTNSYSSFKWSKPLIKILENLDNNEIEEILSRKDFNSIELTKIAKELFSKNKNLELVSKILDEAIKKTPISGWNRHYDGGSKIEAYKLLKKIGNKEDAIKIIFKDFSDSLDVTDYGIFGTIDNVLNLIDDNFNYDKYFNEIEYYKQELLKNHFNNLKIPNINGTLSNDDFLLEIINFLIEFPTNFDDNIFEILIEEFDENKILTEKVLKILQINNYEYEFIKLLSAISLKDLNFVKLFEKNIVELLNHQRFDIHRIAIRILIRLNIDYKKLFISKTKELPLVYKLKIEYKPELVASEDEKIKRLNKTGYLRETNDPIEYCNLYLSEIKLISNECGIDLINIANRIIYLGDKYFTNPSWYNDLTEKEIRDIYEYRFDLKISYMRPRYQKVWCGLMMVIKELWELEELDRGLANYISNSFDENLYFIKPTCKPSFISSIIKKDDYVPYADEKWVHEISVDYIKDNMIFKNHDDFYILAEHTIIEGQGDGFTQEIRQSFVDYVMIDDFGEDYIIFEKCHDESILNYINIEVDGLCFYNSKMTINNKVNWLAFNPQLAFLMGLKLSTDGNFRWLDENNKIVIESIFWKNNDTRNRSRNLHSECGYGWYVMITSEGLEKLKQLDIYPTNQFQKISRKLTFIQTNYDTYIDESNYIINSIEIN